MAHQAQADGEASERPRERLLRRGPASLTTAELLAALLRTGARTSGVVDFAHGLLHRFGGLGGLFEAPPEALAAVPGMGAAKTASILALKGLLARYDAEALQAGAGIGSSEAAKSYLRHRIGHRCREVFGCLFLDARHRLIKDEEIFHGSVNRAAVYPREIIRASMRHNASAVVLYHNHPSGVVRPSASDIEITRRIKMLLDELDVDLVDHVVVGGAAMHSFAESGLMAVVDGDDGTGEAAAPVIEHREM